MRLDNQLVLPRARTQSNYILPSVLLRSFLSALGHVHTIHEEQDQQIAQYEVVKRYAGA
jgi:hypothetical protein